jgi:hypothetical protein
VALAPEVIAKAAEHHEWEEFSRMRLMEGAPLQRYYPLHADAWPEYEEWKRTKPSLRDDARRNHAGAPLMPPVRQAVIDPAFDERDLLFPQRIAEEWHPRRALPP